MGEHILTPAEIEALAAEALRRHGASDTQAAALAAGIAAAERDGIASHGLMYLPTYCEHLTCGKVVGAAAPVAYPRGAREPRGRCRGRASRMRRSISAARR